MMPGTGSRKQTGHIRQLSTSSIMSGERAVQHETPIFSSGTVPGASLSTGWQQSSRKPGTAVQLQRTQGSTCCRYIQSRIRSVSKPRHCMRASFRTFLPGNLSSCPVEVIRTRTTVVSQISLRHKPRGAHGLSGHGSISPLSNQKHRDSTCR